MNARLPAPGREARRRFMPGFTMIEVLVTLVIMMFGLLGIAGLILKGHKASSEAYQRNQALLLVADMAEKMKANRLIVPQPPIPCVPATVPVTMCSQPSLYPLNAGPYITGGTGLVTMPAGSAAVVLPDCSLGCANGTNALVDYDLASWNNLLVGTQETNGAANIGGILNARGCVAQPGGAGTAVRISVAWQGDQATVVPATSNCGLGLYGAADNQRRVVSIDIL